MNNTQAEPENRSGIGFGVGLVACVRPGMPRQVAGLSKALAAGRTHVGLLACMGPGMASQGAGIGKTLATGRAHKGFFARVGSGMLCQVAGSSKALPTRRAHVGLLARVGPGVHSQVSSIGKVLAAAHAHKRFLARVRPGVHGQRAGLHVGEIPTGTVRSSQLHSNGRWHLPGVQEGSKAARQATRGAGQILPSSGEGGAKHPLAPDTSQMIPTNFKQLLQQ